MRIRAGSYTVDMGNPATGGIVWWFSVEKIHGKIRQPDGGIIPLSWPVFRLQFNDGYSSYPHPRGWMRVA